MAITFFNWTSGTGGDYLLNLAYLWHQKERDENFLFDGFAMGQNQWTAPVQDINLETGEDVVSCRFIHIFKTTWHMPWKNIAEDWEDKQLIIQTHSILEILEHTVDHHDREIIYDNTHSLVYSKKETRELICDLMHAKAIEETRDTTDEWVDHDNDVILPWTVNYHTYEDVFLSEDTSAFRKLLGSLGVDLNDEEFLEKADQSRKMYNQGNSMIREIYNNALQTGNLELLNQSQEKRYTYTNINSMLLRQSELLMDIHNWVNKL